MQHHYSTGIFFYCGYPLLCVQFKHVLNVLFVPAFQWTYLFTFFNSQAVEAVHSKIPCCVYCIKYQMYQSICLQVKSSFFSCLVQRGTSAVCKTLLLPFLLLSRLVSSCLVSPPHLLPPLLLSGQSSLCLLYLLSHFVKNLSGQPSDWPLGPAGDEAILILSGITAKLVVFSSRTVAAE